MLMSEGGAVASRARRPSHATGLLAVWIEQCGFRGPCPSVTTKYGGSTVAADGGRPCRELESVSFIYFLSYLAV